MLNLKEKNSFQKGRIIVNSGMYNNFLPSPILVYSKLDRQSKCNNAYLMFMKHAKISISLRCLVEKFRDSALDVKNKNKKTLSFSFCLEEKRRGEY